MIVGTALTNIVWYHHLLTSWLTLSKGGLLTILTFSSVIYDFKGIMRIDLAKQR